MDMSLDKAEAALVAKELRTLLEEAVPLSCALPKVTLPNYDNVPGNLMLSALGLRLGDRVLLDGQKVRTWGMLRRARGQAQIFPVPVPDLVCPLPVLVSSLHSSVP